MTFSSTQYPSIHSIEGSAARNCPPILTALHPLISRLHGKALHRPVVLEIASGTGHHIRQYASEWKGVEFQPTERMEDQIEELRSNLQDVEGVREPRKLDIFQDEDWRSLRAGGDSSMSCDAVIINNLFHCSPPESSQAIFSHLSPVESRSDSGSGSTQPGGLLKREGWIGIYGAFLMDDGGFATEGDRKFDERFKSLDPSFGLRTIPSLEDVANKCGLVLKERKEMPAGNWWLVFGAR